MAANDPGIPPVPFKDDPLEDEETQKKKRRLREIGSPEDMFHDGKGMGEGDGAATGGTSTSEDAVEEGEERPVAPDQFDPRYETGKWEIWAYYAYYIGDNGLTLFNFAPTAFQNLLSEAAGDAGVVQFAGGERTVESVVLLCNGISFALQSVLFLIIGSYAGEFVQEVLCSLLISLSFFFPLSGVDDLTDCMMT